ncbi:MAG: right-handed parallel beta-helix repeat-containing protein [Bacteroidota bacterium]
MKYLSRIVVSLLVFFAIINTSFATNYTVTTTADVGAGSLREAITNANASIGPDNIYFNIPTSDGGYNAARSAWVFTPGSAYPMVQGSYINIDATSQTTNQGNLNLNGPEIVIDGGGTLANAFIVVSNANTIKGLCVIRCTYGITIYNATATNNKVTECYVGIKEDGATALGNQYGIAVSGNASATTISNCLISGNTGAGIAVQNTGNVTVTGCRIGTNAMVTLQVPNQDGVVLDNAYYVTVGGNTPSLRNIISGNSNAGIIFNGNGSHHNNIIGNFIGTDSTTLDSIPNVFGIVLYGARNNTIGGINSAYRNVVSGNSSCGILLNGSGTNDNVISANYVGLDSTGMIRIPNHTGILLKSNARRNRIGGTTTGERNVVSGNFEIGIYLEACDSNTFEGNYVGPAADGITAIVVADSMFQGNGLELNTVARYNIVKNNVISGNRVYGFIFYGQTSYNELIGNYIGTDATGNVSMRNATGICVDCASNHNKIYNNVLSGNISYGIFIVTTGTYYNDVKGNLIGTNAAGTDTVPNDIGLILGGGARYNIIGGTTVADRNIISGNRYEGIEVADVGTKFNEIRGNYIGTDITGALKLPNLHGVGLATYPKKNIIDNNLISGNREVGIILYEMADSNYVYRNKIGTAADGITPLSNNQAGIAIDEGASYNVIGGDTLGNIIAFNRIGGIVIRDTLSLYNTISGNATFGNHILSGIDLWPPLMNTNDPGDGDIGPNENLNYPVNYAAAYDTITGLTAIYGEVDIPITTGARVEVFVADNDSTGCGEGMIYLGHAPHWTGNLWWIDVPGLTPGQKITATTTDAKGNTSEFAPNVVVTKTTSIAEHSDESISVYPNPFDDKLYVHSSGNSEITIFNMVGEQVYQIKTNDKNVVLPLKNLKSGIYFLRLKDEKGNVVNRKIVKN